MQLCCLPPGCPIIVLFSLLAAIFKQIQKAGAAEKYVSANFMKIDVNRGKIQIRAPTEGQPVLGSRPFAKCHSSAGRLIPQHKAREPAAALLPAGDGVRATAERRGEERSSSGLRMELKRFVGQESGFVNCIAPQQHQLVLDVL